MRGVAKKILYRLFQLVRRVGANGVLGGAHDDSGEPIEPIVSISSQLYIHWHKIGTWP